MEVLLLPKPLLMRLWTEAFDQANVRIREELTTERPVILTFHAVWFHLGVREYVSGINFSSLANLQERPDIVFTLIDDIYDIKARLTQPNGVFSYAIEEPDDYVTAILRLLQILDWRSTENVLSSKVAEVSNALHFVLPVKHPISVFHDLFVGTGKKSVYIAHPISEIRRLLRGDEEEQSLAETTIDRIRDLSRGLREQFIVFEPTAIDELRFDLNIYLDNQSMDVPCLGQRWRLPSEEHTDLLFTATENADQAFGQSWTTLAEEITRDGVENLGQEKIESIRLSWPLLATLQDQILQQITSRDYSLLTQTNGLAAYRPAFRGNESRGVRREITHTQTLRQIGMDRATVVILHPDSDEQDSLLENFNRLINEWKSQSILVGSPEQFASLSAELSFGDLKPIQDGDTDRSKGREISELLRRWEIVFVTRASGAMAPDPAVVAREDESERGRLFSRIHSYIAELVETEDVEVISEELSIQEFTQRVFDRINNNR